MQQIDKLKRGEDLRPYEKQQNMAYLTKMIDCLRHKGGKKRAIGEDTMEVLEQMAVAVVSKERFWLASSKLL